MSPASASALDSTHRLDFRAFGCRAAVLVDAVRGAPPLAGLPERCAAHERVLSRFRTDSELCQLNRRGGERTVVSEALLQALETALAAAHWTAGLVQPNVLTALERAGYDRDFERLPRTQPANGDAPMPAFDAWRRIEIDREHRTVLLPEGVRLDFGGTAKGAFADATAASLARFGPTLVDFGGDIAVSGPRARGSWPIAIGSPLLPGQVLGRVDLRAGGIATSGLDHRRWQQGAIWRHHLIDPRTGEPAVTDVLAATVVGPGALAAEIAAKTVVLLGVRAGLAWLEQQAGCGGLAVAADGGMHCSRGFEFDPISAG